MATDVSTVTRSGTIVTPVKFAVLRDTGSPFSYFTINSEFNCGDKQITQNTNVLVMGQSVSVLKEKKDELAGAKVVLAGVVAYVGESGEICCRVTSPEQLQIFPKPTQEEFANSADETSAEEFFLNAGCSVDGKKKN